MEEIHIIRIATDHSLNSRGEFMESNHFYAAAVFDNDHKNQIDETRDQLVSLGINPDHIDIVRIPMNKLLLPENATIAIDNDRELVVEESTTDFVWLGGMTYEE